jgi:putative membrane protein
MRSSSRWALAAGIAVVTIAVGAPSILAQGKGSAPAPPAYVPDHTFLLNAATAGLEQVRLARLAVLRAANPDVKGFAQRLVDERGKANDQLRQLASGKGVKDLPAHPDRSTQALFDSLDKRSGDNFDVSYIQQTVADMVSDVAQFDAEAQNGADADLRKFAASVLPALRERLRTAQAIESKIAGRSNREPTH